MENLTIIYYTSNREKPEFEQRVRDNIYNVCGNTQIISVSQKPINFGKNICVGDVGVSGFNMFRQVQIALREVKTDFVVSTEADCLYPPEYFQFVPYEKNVCYRNYNTWVMPQYRSFYFHKKEGATHSQVVGTKYYLDTLDTLFGNAPDWSSGKDEFNFPKERSGKDDVFDNIEYFRTDAAVVQIKSTKSMRYYTHSERTPVYELPYWGEGKQFRRKYYEAH